VPEPAVETERINVNAEFGVEEDLAASVENEGDQ
jgi:hypothetical protein